MTWKKLLIVLAVVFAIVIVIGSLPFSGASDAYAQLEERHDDPPPDPGGGGGSCTYCTSSGCGCANKFAGCQLTSFSCLCSSLQCTRTCEYTC